MAPNIFSCLPKPYKIVTPPWSFQPNKNNTARVCSRCTTTTKINANCLMVLLDRFPAVLPVRAIESAKTKNLELGWATCRRRNQMLRPIRASSTTPPTPSISCNKETTATRVEITDRARIRRYGHHSLAHLWSQEQPIRHALILDHVVYLLATSPRRPATRAKRR
jgi:hypothetical protein